jgi:hypothetical protein
MGYIRHHAIIVTSGIDELIEAAHEQARACFTAEQVSPIAESPVNGYRSFFVAPDGSKEGWEASAMGDGQRDEFVGWLNRQRYGDGSTSLRWVEVQYGDDNDETKIVRDSDAPWRAKREPSHVG